MEIANLVTVFSGDDRDLNATFRRVESNAKSHVNKVNQIGVSLSAFWSSLTGNFAAQASKNMLTNVANEWQKHSDNVRAYFTNLHVAILHANKAFLSFLAGDFKSGFEEIGKAIESAKPAVRSAISLILQVMVEGIKANKDFLYEAGSELGNVIIEGLKAKFIENAKNSFRQSGLFSAFCFPPA